MALVIVREKFRKPLSLLCCFRVGVFLGILVLDFLHDIILVVTLASLMSSCIRAIRNRVRYVQCFNNEMLSGKL